ncbi:YfiR family protein [Pseudoduganella sp.]|uniref:YfiR family protein n=1 Tax=Pseudoduganella sp. TaxID=1880898 RepID=UPI0035AFF2A5
MLLAVLLAAPWPLLAHAQAGSSLERQVKAAYLYKFAGFVEWPEGSFPRPDSAVVIGVAGADALADQLEQTVAGHTANGRPLQVRRLRRGDSLGGVHMLFVSGQDKSLAHDLLSASRGQPVLTVTDADDTFGLGSMINFLIADERLRFEVSLKPALAARLKISARMLSAAYRVQQVAG